MHTSNKKPVLFPVLLLLVLFALLLSACAPQVPESFEYSENNDKGDLVLYVFWGDGCSHCEAAKPFLGQLNETYPTLRIRAQIPACLFTKLVPCELERRAPENIAPWYDGRVQCRPHDRPP